MNAIKILLAISLLFLFSTLSSVQAAGLVPCGGEGQSACQFCDFFVLINNIIRFVMIILVPVVAVLMLVIGGVLFLFAGAKPDALNKAKGIITSVVIGLLIIFSAWVIVNTVFEKSGIIQTEGWRWYEISCTAQ